MLGGLRIFARDGDVVSVFIADGAEGEHGAAFGVVFSSSAGLSFGVLGWRGAASGEADGVFEEVGGA